MAITITEIITVEDYIGAFPQDANVEEDLIQSAINRATITLDAICGGMIAKVWSDQIPSTDPLYRTAEEKNCIKQAHLIQAQYNVSRNLDMSAGTESYTSGSNNYNETRPRPEMVADEIIYQLLARARVYNPNVTTDTTIKLAGGNIESFYDPSYNPGSEYITVELGDNRYVHKHFVDGAGKYAKWDENGNIIASEIKASEFGTSTTPAYYLTIGDTEYQLGGNSHTRYIELYGNGGTVTDDQLTVLKETTNNYIWWAENDSATQGHILYVSSYNPNVSATYQTVDGNKNYKLSIDLVTKQWTIAQVDFIETLGNEEVSHQPYHFPYHFTMGATAGVSKSTLSGNLYTITLDNNKTLLQYPLSVEIPAPTNMVTTDTEQTITATKTFGTASNGTIINANNVKVTLDNGTDYQIGEYLSDRINFTDGAETFSLAFPLMSGTIALTRDIPSTTNFVTLDSDQQVAGTKRWTTTTSNTYSQVGNGGVEVGYTDPTTSAVSKVNLQASSTYGASIQYTLNNSLVGNIVFPQKNGTIALLSDIETPANMVTTNTDQTIQATKTLKSKVVESAIQPYFSFTNESGTQNYGQLSQSGLIVSNGQSGSNFQDASFGYNNIQMSNTGGSYYYTFPTTSGTLALTSNIPTNVSQLVNDVGYITSSVLSNYATTTDLQQGLATREAIGTCYTKTEVNTKLTDGSVTKVGTATKGSATQPIYLNAGTPTAGTTYAGGTNVTLNGTGKSGSTASFYAPTAAGTSGQYLKSSGGTPAWDSFGLGTWTNVAWSGTSGVVFAPASGFTFSTASGHSNKYRTDTLGRIEVSLRTTITTSNSISANSFLQIGTLNKKNGSMDVWVVASVLVGGKYYSLPMHITDGGAVYLSNTTASALSLSGAQLQVSFFTA